MSEVRSFHQRRHVCTYGEWQSAGVPSAAAGGCCFDACADVIARSANSRARSTPAFCIPEVRFFHQRRHVCTYGEWQSTGVFPLLLGTLFRRLRGRARSFCEWQSAGVLRLLYVRGTIPSSATARSYIRRMAERRRSARCCWGCCSDACADTPERCGSVGLCPCGGYGPYSQPKRLCSAEA